MKTKISTIKFRLYYILRLSIILFILSILNSNITAQVREDFEPRSSVFTPGKTVYSIKGDFTIIGNTNLSLTNYSDTRNNSNNSMQLVDEDGDSSTSNSSAATLSFSNENGAITERSNIIYAGLYWTARGSNLSSTAMRTIKIKAPGGSYQTLVADANELRYPGDNDMYAGYTEVTEIVQAGGIGEYWVADMALSAGNGGSTGYYGGWGMVVVYENSLMKWRDITVFDGYAYVRGSTTVNHTIDVSGFKAVQNGDVNVNLDSWQEKVM